MFRLLFIGTLSTVSVVMAQETAGANCVLPPYPEFGAYVVLENSTAEPGQSLVSYVLNVTCDDGFHLMGNAAPTCQGWNSDDLPLCIPYCTFDDPNIISCGTTWETCYTKRSLNSAEGSQKMIRHQNDKDCGKVGIDDTGILSGGQNAERYELPWHAGIYSKNFMPYMQICGGSLVSSTVIITAAHCFWDDVNKLLPAENYAVAVGKIYRPWNDLNDTEAQKSDVREIKIPPRFLGSAANFQEDLALVVIRNVFFFNEAVRPVCLDFDYDFDVQQLTSGALGKVAGWGLVSQDGRPSPTLQVAQVPYIAIEECIAAADPTFRTFLTGDKICAGYTNGTAVCKGDSGGGLSFLSLTPVERHYLRGVVSAAPRSDHLCSVYHWATFTHLLSHQYFILTVLQDAKKNTVRPTTTPKQPSFMVQDVKEFSYEASTAAKPIEDTTTVKLTTPEDSPYMTHHRKQWSHELFVTKQRELNYFFHSLHNYFKN